ncbi:hypothetical protein GCM10018785_28730 [Streptomyces longispororuber]|uniref:Novel STAND NTPase 1 domain-containing protein n=1 Tax=Streptomyces longispororuber TaxID=68230 RepID=A0A918ZLP4_9ACTN|nr:WD40 repeat domain-containing protein [Streptomyces longispororuber]GHE57874.1 hypothetical protein GCM10018785_28730 [Streptomyces longispororuber]
MTAPRRMPLDLTALLVGVALGFGTNLVTADPAGWWGPLPLVERYAPLWLPLGIAALVVAELVRRRVERRRVTWTGSGNPYPGLEAYGPDRAEVFFGRRTATDETVDRVAHGRAAGERWITVVGPSGSGKSSLLAAGVLPRLRRGHTVLGPLRPGAARLTALARALFAGATPGRDEVGRLADDLREEAAALAAAPDGRRPTVLAAALLAAQDRGSRVVLAVDQVEEVFRRVPEEERAPFLGLLRSALRTLPQFHVLAALPTEYLRDAATGPYADLFRARVLLPPLGVAETRAVIAGPARAAGVDIDAEVVEILTAEATAGNTLPLLGQLLRDLYDAAAPGAGIGRELLESGGPLAESIGRHAEAVYGRLVARHPAETVDAVLLAFVSWDERGRTRRLVAADALDGPRREIAEELREARLLTGTEAGDALDFVHEALLRNWPRLRDLVARHEEALRLVTDLERRAATWRAQGEPPDDLLRGSRLAQAADLTAAHDVSAAVRDLVAASRERERREAGDRADALAAAAQQVYAAREEPALALALAATAVREVAATPASVLTLWAALRPPAAERLALGHAGRILALGWDPASGLLRTLGEDGQLATWTAGGDPVGQEDVGLGPLTAAGLGGGAAYWAAARPPGPVAVRRFDRADPVATTDAFGPNAVAVSRDGRWVAASFTASGVTVVDLDGADDAPAARRTLEAQGASGLRWSPDATHLLVIEYDTLRVVRTADAATLWTLSPYDSPRLLRETCVDWSPDGGKAAVGAGQLLRVVSAGDGRTVAERGTSGAVLALSWSPDGRFLAVAEEGWATVARIAVYEASSPDLAEHREIVPDGRVEALAWSGDATRLAWASGADAHVREMATGRERALATGTLNDVSWNGDRVAATARGSGTVRVVRTGAAPEPVRVMAAQDPRPATVAWQPGGDLLAVAFKDRVELWDAVLRTRAARMTPDSTVPALCAWSPDGTALATLGRDFWQERAPRVEVWDPATGRRAAVMDSGPRLSGVLAWHPEGTALAGAEDDGRLTVWDPATGARTGDFRTAAGAVCALCWSPDGRALALLGQDCHVSVYDAASGAALVRTVRGGDGSRRLAWSPDGRHLASTGIRRVRFWLAATGECLAVGLMDAVVALDARWLDDRRFAVTGEDHVRYTWTLPGRTDAAAGAALLEAAAAAGEPPRALTAEERRRFGLPAAGP